MNDSTLPKPTPPAVSPSTTLKPGQTASVAPSPAKPLLTAAPPPSVSAPPSSSAPPVPPATPATPTPITPPAPMPTGSIPAPAPAQSPASPPVPGPLGSPNPSPKLPMGAPPPTPVPAPAPPLSPASTQLPPKALSALSSMTATQIPPMKPGETPPPAKGDDKKGGGSTPAATDPKFAAPKKSILRLLPLILGAVVLLGVIGFALTRVLGGNKSQPITGSTTSDGQSAQGTRQTVPGKQVTLQYWGLWEPSEVVEDVFADFEKANPGVTVEYTKQSHKDYRERLQTAVASGSGPDLFRFHASWTPMLKSELAPLPSSVISTTDFKNAYYPVASKQLQLNGQIVGIPLMYDGLVLLYNKEILETAGENPPQTWAELKTLAARLTIRADDEIKRGGLAMGNTSNVEHFSDILAVLMLQNGADFTKPNSNQVRDALLFYTSFMSTDKVWSEKLPVSSVAFARGDVAMIFAPSWRIHEIMATNPNLKIGVAPLPKLSDKRVTWGTYWAEGMSAQSKNKDEAAALLKYLSSPEVLKKLYSEASGVRSFGELYPRVDMAEELGDNLLVAPYLQDAPYAEGWYMSSFTHDNGINDQIIKYYEDAINAVLGGKSAEATLPTVDQGTKQVLRQYGVQ